MRRRAADIGDAVRVPRYGVGQVVARTAAHVDVVFPDGQTRTFLTRFVKRAPNDEAPPALMLPEPPPAAAAA